MSHATSPFAERHYAAWCAVTREWEMGSFELLLSAPHSPRNPSERCGGRGLKTEWRRRRTAGEDPRSAGRLAVLMAKAIAKCGRGCAFRK